MQVLWAAGKESMKMTYMTTQPQFVPFNVYIFVLIFLGIYAPTIGLHTSGYTC